MRPLPLWVSCGCIVSPHRALPSLVASPRSFSVGLAWLGATKPAIWLRSSPSTVRLLVPTRCGPLKWARVPICFACFRPRRRCRRRSRLAVPLSRVSVGLPLSSAASSLSGPASFFLPVGFTRHPPRLWPPLVSRLAVCRPALLLLRCPFCASSGPLLSLLLVLSSHFGPVLPDGSLRLPWRLHCPFGPAARPSACRALALAARLCAPVLAPRGAIPGLGMHRACAFSSALLALVIALGCFPLLPFGWLPAHQVSRSLARHTSSVRDLWPKRASLVAPERLAASGSPPLRL